MDGTLANACGFNHVRHGHVMPVMLGPRTWVGHPRLSQERLVPVSIDHCINAFAVSPAFHAPAMQEAELLSYYMTASIKN